MNKLEQLTRIIMEYNAGNAQCISCFIKVYCFARLIVRAGYLDEYLQFILNCANIPHDFGPCMEKYGHCTGDSQKRRPVYACELLAAFELPQEDIQRICYLVAHRRTYDSMDALDYQILVETDF